MTTSLHEQQRAAGDNGNVGAGSGGGAGVVELCSGTATTIPPAIACE